MGRLSPGLFLRTPRPALARVATLACCVRSGAARPPPRPPRGSPRLQSCRPCARCRAPWSAAPGQSPRPGLRLSAGVLRLPLQPAPVPLVLCPVRRVPQPLFGGRAASGPGAVGGLWAAFLCLRPRGSVLALSRCGDASAPARVLCGAGGAACVRLRFALLGFRCSRAGSALRAPAGAATVRSPWRACSVPEPQRLGSPLRPPRSRRPRWGLRESAGLDSGPAGPHCLRQRLPRGLSGSRQAPRFLILAAAGKGQARRIRALALAAALFSARGLDILEHLRYYE